MNCKTLGPLAILVLSFSANAATLTPVVGNTFTGITFNQYPNFVPSDMGIAVGPGSIVQIVNGGYSVFSRSGATLSTSSDVRFWQSAGIATPDVGGGIFDPRVVYDPGSGRFFATEEDFGGGASNDIWLAVSKTSNPLDGWKAVGFTAPTGFASGFADFPTLGVDANGVYIGTNNFDNTSSAISISVFSIPKSDLLGATPSLARMSSFTGLDATLYGTVPNLALDAGGTHGAVLSLGPNSGQATLSFLSGTSGASAALSAPTVVSGLLGTAALPPLQSGAGVVTTDIDNRFSATSFVVGNLMYAVNGISDGGATHDIIHWMILDLATKLVLQQGTLDDPGFSYYTYPSIAANPSGDFMIGFNRSSATDNMSAYAALCHFDGTSGDCGSPLLLAQGLAPTSDGRWGDYSATAIDPTDPNLFWTAIETTAADGTWRTNITELSSVPEPASLALAGGGLLLLFRRRRKA